ncbi:hypothetical protein O2W18_20825 [Modestobacter sp. VKM Ac-2983]|nr:hypothetical protein [Modestobacter sp. VKM Ac-2983]MCZ2807557.1 hypothetical protein [Modestobacter sp. VKM Ac-2983]
MTSAQHQDDLKAVSALQQLDQLSGSPAVTARLDDYFQDALAREVK